MTNKALGRASMLFYYCRFCDRLRRILYDAPWSSFDLIASCILFWLGVFLIADGAPFASYAAYAMLARFGGEWLWGSMFFAFGTIGIINVLWFDRPAFFPRLAARMGVAFCFGSLALNALGAQDPPLATPTYCVLAISALWSVIRTKPCGK